MQKNIRVYTVLVMNFESIVIVPHTLSMCVSITQFDIYCGQYKTLQAHESFTHVSLACRLSNEQFRFGRKPHANGKSTTKHKQSNQNRLGAINSFNTKQNHDNKYGLSVSRIQQKTNSIFFLSCSNRITERKRAKKNAVDEEIFFWYLGFFCVHNHCIENAFFSLLGFYLLVSFK